MSRFRLTAVYAYRENIEIIEMNEGQRANLCINLRCRRVDDSLVKLLIALH